MKILKCETLLMDTETLLAYLQGYYPNNSFTVSDKFLEAFKSKDAAVLWLLDPKTKSSIQLPKTGNPGFVENDENIFSLVSDDMPVKAFFVKDYKLHYE